MKDQRPPQPPKPTDFVIYMDGHVQDMYLREGDAFTLVERLLKSYPTSDFRIDEMGFSGASLNEWKLVRPVAEWKKGQRTL